MSTRKLRAQLARELNSLENADWPKRTWDLHFRNVEELREHIRLKGWTVEQWKELPVYKWAIENGYPAWLKEL
jgi:hypothetical protein